MSPPGPRGPMNTSTVCRQESQRLSKKENGHRSLSRPGKRGHRQLDPYEGEPPYTVLGREGRENPTSLFEALSVTFGDPPLLRFIYPEGCARSMRCREDRWYRAVDYRLYPNATQTKVLEHTLDVLCGLYNDLLDIGLESLKQGNRPTPFDMMKEGDRGRPFGSDAQEGHLCRMQERCRHQGCQGTVRMLRHGHGQGPQRRPEHPLRGFGYADPPLGGERSVQLTT